MLKNAHPLQGRKIFLLVFVRRAHLVSSVTCLLPKFWSKRDKILHTDSSYRCQASVRLRACTGFAWPSLAWKTLISQPPGKTLKIRLVTFLALIWGVYMQNFSPLAEGEVWGDRHRHGGRRTTIFPFWSLLHAQDSRTIFLITKTFFIDNLLLLSFNNTAYYFLPVQATFLSSFQRKMLIQAWLPILTAKTSKPPRS